LKNPLIILNILLTLAVAYLFYLQFSTHRNSDNSQVVNLDSTKSSIVYVNSDSLLNQYDYYLDLKKEAEAKNKVLETEVTGREKAFQNEVMAYQKNAGTMSPEQRQGMEQRLGKKQQDIEEYKQGLSEKLSKEDSEVSEKLYGNISEYLTEYSKKNNHTYVLGFSKGGGILYATGKLDVTKDVVKGLNKAYLVKKK